MRWCCVIVLVLTACSSKPPATPEAVESLIEHGNLQEAAAQSKRLIIAHPADPALRVLLGRIYLAQKDGAGAYDAFDHARALGASEESTRKGLVEGLFLQGRFEQVLSMLPTSLDRSELPAPLLRLRLEALLRTPLARERDIFLDSQQVLVAGGADGVASLEAVLRGEGAVDTNADQIRRAIAYWSCQQVGDDQDPPYVTEPPAWAVRDAASRRTLRVGPDFELKTPSAAARVARDGDDVEIQAGRYLGDVAVWRANDLSIHAVGGKAVLEARGASAENMGIWVVRGNNVSISGIRFSGARSTDQNGSGIRGLGNNLWVSESEFYDNEDGILTAERPGSDVIVERSVFVGNGAGDGYSHNVYVGTVQRLVFRFNYSASAKIGHELKSRAVANYILYNRLADEADGTGSYTIDLPDGGFALILGNEIQQGPNSENRHIVSLGTERPGGREHRFIFAFNTFYNGQFPATLIRDMTGAGVMLIDNIFSGAPANIDARTRLDAENPFISPDNLVDGRGGDYRLKPTATVIDSGDATESVEGVSILPEFEYRHPAGVRRRHEVWRRDPGAHEFCGWPEHRD